MIAVSSFRPHRESDEYAANQIKALESWLPLFSKIIYLGDFEPALDRPPKTQFQPLHHWPRIKDLIRVASKADTTYSVILNGDIILGPQLLTVFRLMSDKKARAGVSRRFVFDPPLNPKQARLVDFGLDVFIATPEVWRRVHPQIPSCLRLGHITWDTWLIGWLNDNLGPGVVDFTDFRCVFHPNHQGRSMPHIDDIQVKDFYMSRAALPGRKLK